VRMWEGVRRCGPTAGTIKQKKENDSTVALPGARFSCLA
jgi:hypothetical protein